MSYFFIESKHNGLVLDIKGGAKGANIITWKQTGRPTQFWAWKDDMLISKTGYVLDVNGGYNDTGTNALAWDQNGGASQRWKMDGDQIISKLNGLVLAIKGQRREAGGSVILWKKRGSSNQAWKMEQASSVSI